MSKQKNEIERLEKAFWQSILEGSPQVATEMLTEPALMVSGHGANKFDHAAYTKMANDDRFKLLDYKISAMDVLLPTEDVAVASYRVVQKVETEGKATEMDVYDTSTWVKVDGQWRCVMHTESPAASKH
ncbi:nuclear transport factor 2 family protein [Lysobacter sp. CA196]|uniref:nuclear transport factor 2 family protein n=1 Tax=Lysobacter sp. CA196 TaxID=3455606 RepID=UPI003F8D806F